MSTQAESSELILVVGMHRSGTSLLTSLLHSLGVATPGPLIEADLYNPDGYHERQDITDLQEDLLVRLGRWWPSQSGVEPLPTPWRRHPATRVAVKTLRQLLSEEIVRQSGPWAIKDPRTSLLLPMWQEVAEQLSLRIKLVLAVRDPAEVMTSLLTRDGNKAGMTAWRAQQLWWRHHRSLLMDRGDLPLQVVHYSRWFTHESIRQLGALQQFCRTGEANCNADPVDTLRKVRTEHRRSRRWIHAPIHPKIRQLEQRLLAVSDGREALQDLEAWLSRQPDPISLPLASWRRGHASKGMIQRSSWGAAAVGLGAGQAAVRLDRWLKQGGPDAQDLTFLELLPAADVRVATVMDVTAGENWSVMGAEGRDWWLHSWLDQLPIKPTGLHILEEGEIPAKQQPLLHLQDLETTIAQGRLQGLESCSMVLDPCETRVHQMQWLGINAHALKQEPDSVGSGWLNWRLDRTRISARLGLPDPEGLTNPSEMRILVLGKGEAIWERELSRPFWYLPGFDAVHLGNGEDARLLASWLQQCQNVGLQLVRLKPTDLEKTNRAWESLRHPHKPDTDWQAPQLFRDPIGPMELKRELKWRHAGRQQPSPLCATPKPESISLWSNSTSGKKASASICISLYNYASRITQALDSVLTQTQQDLELVIVDDHSTDSSEQKALQWLKAHSEYFARSLLLRHTVNSGLSATRNTAFQVSECEWCFVLDADNQLLPEAVEECLKIARNSDARTAVIHPLIELRVEGEQNLTHGLLTDTSWQAEQFRHGNVVDAMALVRRNAWQEVGGYTHIPGGWEDFDFWCQLMDTGWHGVLCPQRLAVYNRHKDSMLESSTQQRARSLSRLLQARHPWLRLAPADPDS